MRIAAGTIGYLGYGDPGKNRMLLDLYCRILDCCLDCCSARGADLVCLPAGFFCARNEPEKDKLASALVAEARRHNIAIAVGVDTLDKRLTPEEIPSRIRSYSLPWFAICWTPKQPDVIECWRQRSSTSGDAHEAPVHALSEVRSLPVQDGQVEILTCGEIFNQPIRANIIQRKKNLDAVIILGHESRGFRVWNGMKILSKQGLITLCSVHTKRKGIMKFRYGTDGICQSTRDADIILNADPPTKLPRAEPRVELKIWDV